MIDKLFGEAIETATVTEAQLAADVAGKLAPAANIQTATSITAVKTNHYILFSGGAATVTLPASPNTGDVVWITVANGLANNVVGRHSQKIMGVSEDMTIDTANVSVQLRYANTAAGWIIT
jgi:hypothetical protein